MVQYKGHTIKPGTPEHKTPAEQRNIPEQWRNNRALPGIPAEHPRIPTEYQRNTSGTPPEQRNHTKLRPSPKTIRKSYDFLTIPGSTEV